VILLDHRVNNQFATRRLRIVKYRGSIHGADEYPFLIGNRGFSVMPMTSLGSLTLRPPANLSGIPRLDAMLGGRVTTAAAAFGLGTAAAARPVWRRT